MRRFPWPNRLLTRFGRQLSVLLGAGILLTAFGIALLGGSLIHRHIENQALEFFAQATRDLSQRSKLLAIVGVQNTVLAREELNSLISYPGVGYAALLSPTGSVSAWLSLDARQTERIELALYDHELTVHQDDRYWHYIVPIVVEPDPADPRFERQLESRDLGYLHLAWLKAPLQAVVNLLLGIIVGVSLIVGVIMVLAVNHFSARLTAPLYALAEVMKTAALRQSSARVRVDRGPQEMRDIAAVYNAMMTQLDSYHALLEQRVQERTLALKQARDAAMKTALFKSRFLATVTHEMRNPLHNINGYAQIAAEESDFIDDRHTRQLIRQHLSKVTQESQALLEQIEALLTHARLDSAEIAVVKRTVSIPDLVATLQERIQPNVERQQNTLSVSTCGYDQAYIDDRKWMQIALNLLTNACKFTRKGHITLAVTVDENQVELIVADTGIGIASKHLEAIFDPFFQADMTDKRLYGGTGLGLAIAKQFALLQGGDIQVVSTLGVGSTFRCWLPHERRPTDGLPATSTND